MTTIALFVVGATMSFVLSALIRRHALAVRLVDYPNERSSHAAPTPRGGGLAIFASFVAGVAWLGWRGDVAWPLAIALLGSGTLVALVGFIDDRGHVDSWLRLGCHAAAAVWALVWLGGVVPFPAFGVTLSLGWLGHALGVVYLVGLLNFFNFMDGIDGIAGLEAIVVSLGGALLWSFAAGAGQWILPALFAACVAGFLVWNFPPAKIFMGDVGSGFIGIVIGVMSLAAGLDSPSLFWSWFILLGCFIVDASVTLIRRLRRGERFDQAHRSHAYQVAARRHGGHRPVTLACAAITLFWLLPLAACVALAGLDGVLGVCIAYAPLVGLAFRYNAGARELQGDDVPHNRACAAPSGAPPAS